MWKVPIIQPAGVLQRAVFAVDVPFVQRPADALGDRTLDLALDIGRMDRNAGILGRDSVQHGGVPGFGIDLDIDEHRADAGGVAGHVLGMGRAEMPARGRRLRRQFLQRQRLEIADIGR